MTMTILIILYLLYPFLSKDFRSMGSGPYEPRPPMFAIIRRREQNSCQTVESSNESDIFTYVCLFKVTTIMILAVETG